MRADIKNFASPDIWDLEHDVPEDPEHTAALIELSIGSVGEPGADIFHVVVCTGSWMTDLARREGGHHFGRHHLVVERWDWAATKRLLRRTIEPLEADTWRHLAELILRYAGWEFEDYQDISGAPSRTGDRTGCIRSDDEAARPGLLVADVKSLSIPDDFDMTVDPTDLSEDFGVAIEMQVGAVGDSMSNRFAMTVCTGSWLTRYVAEHGPLFTRHHLIVQEWQRPMIEELLRTTIGRLEADTWDDLVAMISRYARWEFEVDEAGH